ncbi:MAG: Jag N-terminal domain-containing protein [Actinobacteria bacterium]|nr:Jag N-terminal domain-containing protein [Actinomycetota bacterium]
MEWVETTGRTLEDAKEAALDQLGVAEDDAEFETLSHPKSGLFGRLKVEARVRARVRPSTPRPKRTRQSRSRRANDGEKDGTQLKRAGKKNRESNKEDDDLLVKKMAEPEPGTEKGRSTPNPGSSRRSKSRVNGQASQVGFGNATSTAPESPEEKVSVIDPESEALLGKREGDRLKMEAELTSDEERAVVEEFMTGLLERFSLPATVKVFVEEEGTLEVSVDGEGLGILVGPRGTTLNALQELTRTVVHRRSNGEGSRVNLDVGGYRARRARALERFAAEVAAGVLESGEARSLEEMSAMDRKIVHDTVAGIDGVTTRSEGDEPHRYVVILPEQSE